MKRSAIYAAAPLVGESCARLAARRCPPGEPAIGLWLRCTQADKAFLDSFGDLGNIKAMPRILGRARATESAVGVSRISRNRRGGTADYHARRGHNGHQVLQVPAMERHRVLPALDTETSEPESDVSPAIRGRARKYPYQVQHRRTTHNSVYDSPVRYVDQPPGACARMADALPRGTLAPSPQRAQLHTQLTTVPPPSLFKASVSAAAREKPVPPR